MEIITNYFKNMILNSFYRVCRKTKNISKALEFIYILCYTFKAFVDTKELWKAVFSKGI